MKIQKKNEGRGLVGGWVGVRVDVNGEVKFLCVKKWGGGQVGGGGGRVGGRVGGVRVDVNEEFCEDSKKN